MPLPENRYLSIDVLRGLTLCLMIIVNMSISDALSFAPLLHASWDGFTLTDAVFPTFLFVMGAALAFSLERYQGRGAGKGAVMIKVAKRASLIFLVGMFVSNFPFFKLDAIDGIMWQSIDNVRILGVLQRIALTYAIATLLLHFTGLKGALVYCLIALFGYWWIMSSFGDYSLTGNAALKLDTFILGASHLYKGEGVPFDPEGLLGTIPSVVNVLAGYMAVMFLRKNAANLSEKVETGAVIKLALAGALLIVTSLFWNTMFPINKKLWTSSYVLCTVGVDCLLLAVLVLFIDILSYRSATGYFEVFGKNTLIIYVIAEVLMGVAWTIQIGDKVLFMWIYEKAFAWAGAKFASLLFAIALMQLCWLIGYIMDKKKIYIRL